ncbi:MAG: toprim domain-containing protein, partial [Pseudobdellovibrionaceae bacterium]
YHVLHGSIAPLEGVRPEDLKIQQLLERVKQSQLTAQPIKELILALDSDLEGDTTVLYITRKFQNLGIKISRIAQGIPMGSDIDFIDDRTMGRALENRLEIEQN